MDRVLDGLSERIWFHIENQTASGWDSEWSQMWTSAWNYDDIHMIYHPKYNIWCWTDGIKGTTLV